jgi:hypothetical protein
MTAERSKNGKRLVAVISVAIAAACFWSIDLWPERTALIQMTLYTYFVFGPLTLGLWSSRDRPRFWTGALLVCGVHGLVLYLIRSIFPFKSVLIIVPISLVEAAAMYMFMLKVIGDAD